MATGEALREGPEWICTTMLFLLTGLFNTGRVYQLITLGPDIRTLPRLGELENTHFLTRRSCGAHELSLLTPAAFYYL